MHPLDEHDLDILTIWLEERILQRLDRIEHLLRTIARNQGVIIMDLTQLTAAVTADTDAVTAASTLLTQLSALITANVNDPVALAALATQLEQNNAALSAAVLANTPAAPPA